MDSKWLVVSRDLTWCAVSIYVHISQMDAIDHTSDSHSQLLLLLQSYCIVLHSILINFFSNCWRMTRMWQRRKQTTAVHLPRKILLWSFISHLNLIICVFVILRWFFFRWNSGCILWKRSLSAEVQGHRHLKDIPEERYVWPTGVVVDMF